MIKKTSGTNTKYARYSQASLLLVKIKCRRQYLKYITDIKLSRIAATEKPLCMSICENLFLRVILYTYLNTNC